MKFTHTYMHIRTFIQDYVSKQYSSPDLCRQKMYTVMFASHLPCFERPHWVKPNVSYIYIYIYYSINNRRPCNNQEKPIAALTFTHIRSKAIPIPSK